MIAGTLLVQFVLMSISFPISQLLTQKPLFYIDSPVHWYLIESAKAFISSWRLVGYDPYFAAGYVGGVTFNTSGKLAAALTILLTPWLSDIVIYKLLVFVTGVLAPSCVALSARWLRLPVLASYSSTVIAVLIWWVGALRWFDTAGMVSFVLCSYVALPYAVFVVRYLTEPLNQWALVCLTVVGALGFFTHPHFPLLVGPLVVALAGARRHEVCRGRLIPAFIVLPALCLALNLPWIIPSFRYESFANLDPTYQRAVDITIIWQEALGRITNTARGSRVNSLIWFASLCMFAGRLEPRQKRIAVAIILASLFFVLFAALGAAVPLIGTAEPNRFSAPAYLYLSIPAGLGIEVVFKRLFVSRAPRWAAAAGALLLTAAIVFCIRELTRELSTADIPHHGERPPEVRGVGVNSVWILGWLERHTTNNARVLFETSKGRIHDDAHMAGYYALTSDREFIGGHYPLLHFAGFWDDYLFGRPIASLSQEEFDKYVQLYNIGWILAFSDKTKEFLDRFPEITPLEHFGPLQGYVVRGPHTFFIEGSGTVSARSFNRIELNHLTGQSVILKYHYVQGLQATPPAHLEPAQMLDDPVPFIRIVNPPSHLTLQLR